MKQKEIIIDNKKFKITYLTERGNYDFARSKGRTAIEVTYYPERHMLSHDALKVLEKYTDGLLKEIRNVIDENSEFYSQFKYDLAFTEAGSQSGYNDYGQEGVITAHKRLILQLKEL
ncbi:MAG: hypothetical protein EOO43_01455 [Flavobacterium sp.]|nr:MAG: hypothetical protein EOO43_01455 [Flavobacterium sp.]